MRFGEDMIYGGFLFRLMSPSLENGRSGPTETVRNDTQGGRRAKSRRRLAVRTTEPEVWGFNPLQVDV